MDCANLAPACKLNRIAFKDSFRAVNPLQSQSGLQNGSVNIVHGNDHVWSEVRTKHINALRRGELSYLAPPGSENISAPYFK